MHLLVVIPSSGRAVVVVRRGVFCRHSRQTRVMGGEK
jgi:hypothetical protein